MPNSLAPALLTTHYLLPSTLRYTKRVTDDVVFDEVRGTDLVPHPRQEKMTLTKVVMKMGIVSSPGAAAAVLACGAFLLIVLSLYLFASAVTPPPVLGEDIPVHRAL